MEQLFENYISLATELAPVLESATDKQSAENAAAPLYNLLPKVYDMRTALQNIENLTPEEATELQQKYANRMQTEWGKVYEHIFRIEKANCYQSLAFFKQFRALCMMLK